jgi:1-aminocyclopropane-1-carboxylate deaminase/D-cysteine desulfhydrase-like pyridoxal-dependent ACC family enzyme
MNEYKLASIVNLQTPSVQKIQPRGWEPVEATVLRLDTIHPVISGNKWYKLSAYLEEAVRQEIHHLVTYGGPWSTHLLATAAAAEALGWTSEGIIRGEEPAKPSAILKQCVGYGMKLRYISRTEYRTQSWESNLDQEAIVIPAGGAGPLGVQGAATLLQDLDGNDYTHIVAAVGTGTMLAGIIRSAGLNQQVWGVPVIKGEDTLTPWIQSMLEPGKPTCPWSLQWGYDEGGYGKSNPGLIEFMNRFYQETGVPTDFVYTAKLFRAVDHWIRQAILPRGSRILCIHSGGLWGNASLPSGSLPY